MDYTTPRTAVTWPHNPPDYSERRLFEWQATLTEIAADVEIESLDVRWRFKGERVTYDTCVSRVVVPPLRPIRFAPQPSGVIFVHAWQRSDIEGTWYSTAAPMLVPAGPLCITVMRVNPAGCPCHCGVFALRHPEGPAQKT